jgi:hypothetical protein
MARRIEGTGNGARPVSIEETVMREVYIRETKHTVINNVREMPREIIYLNDDRPQELGFLGGVGALVAITFVAVAFCFTVSCFAQSNVKEFYGWGDYGANRNIPIPVQPQQPYQPRNYPGYVQQPPGKNGCDYDKESKWTTCYIGGQIDTQCKEGRCRIVDGRPWPANPGITFTLKP